MDGLVGGCIHYLVHSDTYQREKIRGSVMRAVGKSFSRGQGQKDIYVC